MQKRRKRKGKKPFQPPHYKKELNKGLFSQLERDILQQIYIAKEPMGLKKLHTLAPESKLLLKALLFLEKKQLIQVLSNKKYRIKKGSSLLEGMLDANQQGFGFIHNIKDKPGTKIPSKDPFISPDNINGAQHGDTVLVNVTHIAKSGKSEGIIIATLKQGKTQIPGILSIDKNIGIVFPEDKRFPFSIEVKLPKDLKVAHGDAVIVDLKKSTTAEPVRQGTIVEVLGDPDSTVNQIRFVVEKLSLPTHFSPETLAELEQIDNNVAEGKYRKDLRSIPHVTIDGKDARDFDDAVAVHKTKKGYQLHVSIADVSHYVEVGSALDRDAYERGTSVYFPGTVIPMLPEKLSNNLCSLMPHKDRLAVTAILDFDEQGHLLHKSFCKSTIESKHRFTYSEVHQILQDPRDASTEQTPFIPMLQEAEQLAIMLKKNRRKRGAIGFTMPEAAIALDETGKVTSIHRIESNFARNIIEEFMLSANEAVAEFFTEQKIEALYRIHDTPDSEKVKEFSTYAKSLGLHLPESDGTSAWFAHVIDMSRDTDTEFVVSNILLRSMKQAKYSVENVGHFGLAATDYTHFTSPIRRYPDLMVHRELCKRVAQNAKGTKNRSSQTSGVYLSGRERIAIKAEREMNDRLKCIFMEDHIGKTFTAVISGVTDVAFFVELVDFPVSCSIPTNELQDDIYLYDKRSHTLMGQNHHTFYKLGNSIDIVIRHIDRGRNRIIATPVNDHR